MENHILYEDNIIKFNPASAYNKIDNGKLKNISNRVYRLPQENNR